jgi:hypothetical protein
MLAEKTINMLQQRFVKINPLKMAALRDVSRDEAIRIAMLLASLPAPPQTQFIVDDKDTKTGTSYGPLDDDYFKSHGLDDDAKALNEGLDVKGSEFESGFKDDIFGRNPEEEGEREVDVDHSKVAELCQEWKFAYDVLPGVSWGNLPDDHQRRWKEYDCDKIVGSPVV